ncbi:beta-N-acetylhexosaminidase [Acetivibrio saccincola]|uniref:beta-N-acetylhexosaminidase n=1 Tax=Acetivibrio saccincola TaxID=1677857 RepID=UPI002BDECEEC|nr:beta-N-acetylhexosaminidase [Acetivibrio saccincola]HQD29248.1 beta-N-acetylhexosaminidase [Acetivibrio saccincola]
MKKINSLKIFMLLILLFVFLFTGCSVNQSPDLPQNTEKHPEGADMDMDTKRDINTDTDMDADANSDIDLDKDVHSDSDKDVDLDADSDVNSDIEPDIDPDIIDNLVSSMTLEEKIGQLFVVAFRKNGEDKNLYEMDEHVKNQIEKFKIGGVVLFNENISTREQTSNLIKSMQSVSKIPLFISVDEEGGRISRLGSNPEMGITKLPPAKEIGETNDPDLAYRLGRKLGSELYSLGFNMNFAPVADVNTNPQNPVIGDRAFSSDPQIAGIMVEQFVKGMQEQNISSVLKHFPGHGDASEDSHKGAVVIEHSIERLREIEFVPFKKGISSGVDAIMTAHIILPEIEPDNLPATLSNKILTGLLREELNFGGLIITDALEMKAIKKHWSSGEASVMAFKAGADILLMPESLEKAYNTILEAVLNGDIAEERIDKSLYRILKVKYKRGILEGMLN